MADRGFCSSSYFAGIASALALEVLALDVLDLELPPTARIGALAIVVLLGLALVGIERVFGRHQRQDRPQDSVEPRAAQPPPLPRSRSAADDSIGSAPRPEASPNVAGRNGSHTSAAPTPQEMPPLPVPATAPIRAAPASPASGGVRQSETGPGRADFRADGVSPRSPAASEPASAPAAPQPTPPEPHDLIRVWQDYWRAGDGHFRASGLERQLTASGFAARVIDGATVGAGEHVQIVDPQSEDRRVYVLPSFAASPRAVQRWFEDRSDGALTATNHRVIAVAVGRWTDSGTVEIVEKGAVS